MAENEACSSAGSCSRESCEGCPSKNGGQTSFLEELNQYSSVGKVIGVISGKGGVGKSFVTASLACEMHKAGCRVGILDADITGPSIPKMLGVHGTAFGSEKGIIPLESDQGIPVMSINLLIEDEEQPVIWRGPVVAGAVKQFWTDVVWGELDYLFVDMPPGTGDVPLTVFQSLPVDGVVIVTSPQELVQMIVKKAYNMAEMMQVPVLGVVENFSYLSCPDCGKKIPVFGESHVEEVAGELNIPVFAKLPIEPDKAAAADAGAFYGVDHSAFAGVVEAVRQVGKP